jgi:hypothetical protein
LQVIAIDAHDYILGVNKRDWSVEVKILRRFAAMVTIDGLWKALVSRKRIVAAIMGASVLVGVLLASFFPFLARGVVTLNVVPNFEALPYQEPGFSRFIQIDRNITYELFADALNDGSILRKILVDRAVVVKQPGQSDDDFDQKLSRAQDRFRIVPPVAANARVGIKDWTIEYETRKPEQGYTILRELIDTTNASVKKRLLDRFNTQLSEYSRLQSYVRADNLKSRGNLLADYDRITAIRLAGIDEEANLLRITRNRDVRVSVSPDKPDSGAFSTATVIDTNKLVILPGSEYVEKQAEIIRSRKMKEDFISGLLPIDQKLRDLDQDTNIERANIGLKTTPLVSDDFRAVRNDLTRASFKKGVWPLVAFLGAVLVGLLTVVSLLLAGVFRESSARQN